MQRLLRLCEEIEQTVSEIYRHWQTVFSHDPALVRLWAKLADDELDHVNQVKLAQRVCNDQVFGEEHLRIDLLEDALTKARQLLKEVRERDVSAEKALRTAIKIEEHFSKAHLLNATHVKDESMKAMFKSLARADELHIATLRDYCKSVFGSD